VLDRLRAGALADAGQRHVARFAVERRGPHLDELVVRQRTADFGDHRVGQALLAQLQDRVQGVRARPERLSRGGRQRRPGGRRRVVGRCGRYRLRHSRTLGGSCVMPGFIRWRSWSMPRVASGDCAAAMPAAASPASQATLPGRRTRIGSSS